MRKKKLLKILLLTLTTVIVLLLLAFVAFLYNPFEGSLPDMRGVVPRDIDFFMRKKGLQNDFPEGRFPEPEFWSDLGRTNAWRQFQTGPLVQDLRAKGIESTIRQLRDAVIQIDEQSSGHLNLMRDVLGTELEVAGRFKPPRLEDTEWCAYMRISWRMKAVWGCLGFGFVQDRVRSSGVAVRKEGDLLVFEPRGAHTTYYAARYKDCLLIGNSKTLVEKSYRLASVEGSDSLGGSADYRDGVETRIREWETRTKVPEASALELYLRPDRIDQILKFADRWPNAQKKDDMNERVLAAFVNLKGWRFLTGALVFESKSLTCLAKIDLDRNKHSAFQTKFFQTEAQERSQWLDPFLSMVPLDSCACAAMRMPPGDFLREMYRSLENSERELLNDNLRKTGKYNGGINELIEKLETALLPRTGFVFRKNEPDKQITVAYPSAVPQIAWVFWTREGTKQPLREFIDTLYHFADSFGLKPYRLAMTKDKEGDFVNEFANPHIPGTGEFALIIFDRFFILSNSGPLVRDMFNVRLHSERSIRASPQLQEFLEQGEVPNLLNGFGFAQGRQLQALLEDYQMAFNNSQVSPDPAWSKENRGMFETELFKKRYSAQFGSIAAMDRATKGKFDEEVDSYIDEQWKKQGQGVTEPARAELRQMIALSQMFSAACMVVSLDPQWLKFSGRALIEYRDR